MLSRHFQPVHASHFFGRYWYMYARAHPHRWCVVHSHCIPTGPLYPCTFSRMRSISFSLPMTENNFPPMGVRMFKVSHSLSHSCTFRASSGHASLHHLANMAQCWTQFNRSFCSSYSGPWISVQTQPRSTWMTSLARRLRKEPGVTCLEWCGNSTVRQPACGSVQPVFPSARAVRPAAD